MGYMIDNEAYNVGLEIIISQLKQAIKSYSDFLITFGTAPNMKLVEELEEKVASIKFKELEEDNL